MDQHKPDELTGQGLPIVLEDKVILLHLFRTLISDVGRKKFVILGPVNDINTYPMPQQGRRTIHMFPMREQTAGNHAGSNSQTLLQ